MSIQFFAHRGATACSICCHVNESEKYVSHIYGDVNEVDVKDLSHGIDTVYHIFHESCLKAWVNTCLEKNRMPTCPTCLRDILASDDFNLQPTGEVVIEIEERPTHRTTPIRGRGVLVIEIEERPTHRTTPVRGRGVLGPLIGAVTGGLTGKLLGIKLGVGRIAGIVLGTYGGFIGGFIGEGLYVDPDIKKLVQVTLIQIGILQAIRSIPGVEGTKGGRFLAGYQIVMMESVIGGVGVKLVRTVMRVAEAGRRLLGERIRVAPVAVAGGS